MRPQREMHVKIIKITKEELKINLPKWRNWQVNLKISPQESHKRSPIFKHMITWSNNLEKKKFEKEISREIKFL